MQRGQPLLPARVNDDYELELFMEELGPRPHRMGLHLLDFMFFCMNKEPDATLFTSREYSEDFLSYLRELGLVIPQIVNAGDYYNWYGRLENISKEKRLNSKLYSYEVLNRLKLNPCPNFIVSSREEMANALKDYSYPIWFLKCPFDMAGWGMRKIHKGTDLPEIKRKFILEPELERTLDVSFFFNIRDKSVNFYQNLVMPGGQYFGGVLYQNPDDFDSWMLEKGFDSANEKWRKISDTILFEIMKEEPEQSFSVDAFFFRTNSGFDVHPMTEINYRETVGGCLLSLRPFLPKRGTGILITLPVKNETDFNTFMPYSNETKKGIIYLSPPGAEQVTFFCSGRNRLEAENMVRKYLIFAGIPLSV